VSTDSVGNTFKL